MRETFRVPREGSEVALLLAVPLRSREPLRYSSANPVGSPVMMLALMVKVLFSPVVWLDTELLMVRFRMALAFAMVNYTHAVLFRLPEIGRASCRERV